MTLDTKRELGDSDGAASVDAIRQQIERGLAHLWIHTQQYNDLARPDGFVVVDQAEGIWLTDVKGRRYIDAMSGLWVVAVGHGRTELAQIAADQMSSLAYANPFAYATAPAVDLATKIADLSPEGMTRSYFVNSGSAAVETALRMAKQYHHNRGDTKRYKVISRVGSYHGMTIGALSINGAAAVNRVPFEPLMPGSLTVPNVQCERCPFEKTFPDCDVFCARSIEQLITAQQPGTIAAIVAEPISTANGCFVPPEGYWPTLRRICDEHGILLIADEVINGFGRTGRWFAIEHFGVSPDLMTMAKGLTSGYQPLAAVHASQRVADGFLGGKDEAFVGGITFGAHPVACAVALANIEIIDRENLVDNAARTGEHLGAQLNELVARHPVGKAARGIGLMHNLELCRPDGSSFRAEDEIGEVVTRLLRDNGILSRAGAAIQIAPPLVITPTEIDELVSRLDSALTGLAGELS